MDRPSSPPPENTKEKDSSVKFFYIDKALEVRNSSGGTCDSGACALQTVFGILPAVTLSRSSLYIRSIRKPGRLQTLLVLRVLDKGYSTCISSFSTNNPVYC